MLRNKPGLSEKAAGKIRLSIRKRLVFLKTVWATVSGRSPVKAAGERRPTRIAFLCHLPALWSKLEPIYLEANDSDDFETIVIAAHRDGDARQTTTRFLQSKGIRVEEGDLKSLKPDYVFHSVPYEHFYPDSLQPAAVWHYARLCYVPYVGQLIYSSEVAETTHHKGYFLLLRMAFLADEWEKNRLLNNFGWLGRKKGMVVVGSPHAEKVATAAKGQPAEQLRIPMVLWTPRWHTAEGNCHFFEHKDLLLEMSERGEIDFTFRPHPLCLAHLLKTGELTQQEHDSYLDKIARCPHARVDAGDYMHALREHTVFVSDMSSVLGDAFLTGKPVVYTHRIDHFNELGRFMADGFYWATTPAELRARLLALAAGEDPLKAKRAELLATFHNMQPPGAARRILDHIRADRIKS